MSSATTIDERIVEMRFDNKQFESGAKETMDTLDKLKTALNLSTSAKSLEGLDKAAKSISLEGIASGIESLQNRFSTLGIVGMRVIENITDGLMGGLSRAVGFVSDAIVSGGIKRAMNIENAHFQLQALLKDEAKVQAVMDDAMKSVDGTAYAYDEAAKAASQFAASGLQAGDEMLGALRGIVGVAAMTNSEYESISRIFTTVAGNGRLMGDQLLQLSSRGLNAASTIADFFNGVNDGSKEATDSVKELIKSLSKGLTVTEGDIREFVSDGKISFEIFSAAMTEAFADSAERANETFTGAFSNMKSALARIGAEFVSPLVAQNSEVVKLFNALRVQINNVKKTLTFDKELKNTNALSKQFTDQVLAMAKAATTFVENADVTKPMEIFYYGLETVKNGAKGLYSVLAPLGRAFKETFNFSMDDAVNVAEKIESITAKMKLSEEGSKNLHDAFKGVFDVVALLGDGFISLLSAILPIEKPVNSLGGGLLGLAGDAGRALTQFTQWVRSSPDIAKAYDMVSDGIETASNWLSNFINHAGDFVDAVKNFPLVQKVISGISDAFNTLSEVVGKVEFRLTPFTDVLGILLSVIETAGPITVSIVKGIGNAFSFLMDSVSKVLGTGGFNSIYDLFNVAVLSGIGIQLSKFVENINKTVTSAGGFLSGIKKIISGVTRTFDELQTTLKADTLKKIAISLALITGSIFVLSMIDSEKLTESLGAVSILLGELTGIFVLLNKLNKNKKGAIESLGALTSMAFSILVLSSALKKISDIDSDKLLGSLGAISALLIEMTGVAVILSKYGGKVKTGAVGIIAFSAAIYILTSSVKKLGELDVDTLTKGLLSVGALLAELAGFMVVAKFGKFKPSQAVGIVILSASLLILQKAVEGFGSMDVNKLLTGIVAIAAVLAEIAAFSFAAGESKHILSTSVSLIIMAQALTMLEKPMVLFGSMNLKQIGKGLLAMGGALAEITLAMRLMPKNALTIGVGLLAVAGALTVISDVVLKMSVMSWEEIGKGMVTLGGSMAILAIAMNAMRGTLGASAAMLVLSAALAIFVPVLKSLSSMSWEEIAKGLLTLGAAFAVVGVAGMLLSPVIPAILGLAGAMALLGVAAAAVGVGVLALSVGLTTLAASGIAGAAALVEVVKILVVGVLNAITDSAAALGAAVKTVILTACDVIIECVPVIVKTILVVIKEVLTALADNGPEIVSQLLRFIIGVIDALAADLPTVIQSVVNLFMQFFAGIAQALKGMDTSALIEGIVGIGLLSAIMLALAAMATLAPSAMIGVLAMAATIAELSIVLAAIGGLAQIPGLKWLIGEGGVLLQGIGTAIGKFIGGIVGGIMGGVASQLPLIGSDLSSFMLNVKPFIDGASKIDSSMMDGVNALAKTILLLTAADILQGLTSWLTGGSSLSGFGEELAAFGPPFAKFAEDIKNVNPEAVSGAANAALVLADMASTLPNSGGLAGKIFGENNLSDFGKELEAFGPYISSFAEMVKNVQPEAVSGAAQAAQIMADMANTLPNSGGLSAKIFGDNTLSAFGEELDKFAPYLASYAEQVKNVNPEVVQASANAAQVLSDMANTLPNSGGLSALIFGDNTLSSFGEELAKFGPYMAQYAESVSGLNPEVVVNSANAALALSELANGLPNSGGLMSWLTGDNDISTFGESLAKFGNSMSAYYNSVSGIDTNLLDGVITEVQKLIDVAAGTANIDTSGMSAFAKSLQTMGHNGIDVFIKAFSDSSSKVATAITAMVTSSTKAVNTESFKSLGKMSAKFYSEGISENTKVAVSTVLVFVTNIIATFEKQYSKYQETGSKSAESYLKGFEANYGKAKEVGGQLSNNILDAFTGLEAAFKKSGENAGLGFVEGLKSKMGEASSVGAALGNAAHSASKKALDEHSPSKKMGEVGENAGLGFIMRLAEFVGKSETLGGEIGNAAVQGVMEQFSKALSLIDLEEFSSAPVITPIVDLENVRKSVSDINDLFNSAITNVTGNVGSISKEIIESKRAKRKSEVESSNTSGDTYYNLEQNNYSPKALSTIDIYRNTKNLFSMTKGSVKS